MIEGIGQTLHQLARATKKFANSLLTGVPHRHPHSLGWTIDVLNKQLELQNTADTHPLTLLARNLSRSNAALQNTNEDNQMSLIPKLEKDTRNLMQRLKDQLNWNHPRLRYAIRLSLCFSAGFAIYRGFGVTKGYGLF